MKILVLLFIASFTLRAADIAGAWKSLPNEKEKGTWTLVIVQDPKELKGALFPDYEPVTPMPLRGKIQGSRVTLSCKIPLSGSFTLDLRLDGDHLRGNLVVKSRGEPDSVDTFDFVRAPAK